MAEQGGFSEHVIHDVPDWLRSFVEDIVIPCVSPLGFIGQLGYRYWSPVDPLNASHAWQIATYPAPNVVRGPHANDGAVFVGGFRFDVTKLLDALERVDEVVWNSPARFGVGLDGPEISVRGYFSARPIWFRFFHIPPPDEKPGFAINPLTSEITELLP